MGGMKDAFVVLIHVNDIYACECVYECACVCVRVYISQRENGLNRTAMLHIDYWFESINFMWPKIHYGIDLINFNAPSHRATAIPLCCWMSLSIFCYFVNLYVLFVQREKLKSFSASDREIERVQERWHHMYEKPSIFGVFLYFSVVLLT